MKYYWDRIENRLIELGCFKEMALRPGATAEDISRLERHLGLSLPLSLRQSLSIHDGQESYGLVYGAELLSIAGIRAQWDNWRSIDEGEMNSDCAAFMASEPEGVIKPMYCNPAWIPLTHDGGGNHIGLDFDPDKLGQPGQVISFGRDEDTKRLLTRTFDDFLESYVSWLERAKWNGTYLDTEGGT